MTDNRFDFEHIFNASTASHSVLDRNLRVVLANDAYCEMVRLSRDDLIGQRMLDLFPGSPEWQKILHDAFNAAFAQNPATLRELYYPIDDLDGNRGIWWNLDCIPLPVHDIYGPILMLRHEDVTDRVLSKRKRDLIASELQHRIGNILTLIQIMARKTAQSASTLDAFVPAFTDRVRSLGKTHAFLSGDNWDGMTLRQILQQQLIEDAKAGHRTITMEGPDWHLSVLHAQSFAMAIHELAVNSTKFGVLGAGQGKITITWDHPKDGSYHFVWKESGLTEIKKPEVSGFGMQMLTRLLPGQLGGKGVRAFTPTGFHYALVVPQNVQVPVGKSKRSPSQQF